MASPKKLFAKLNLSIKTHFCFLHVFVVTFAFRSLIFSYTYMHFFSFIFFFNTQRQRQQKFSVYILSVSFTFSLGWVWGGIGNLGRCFSSVLGWGEGGTAFQFCFCATSHVSGYYSNPIQERDLNVCILYV